MIKPGLSAKLLKMVAAFEGGHVGGNFDGQVLSWGALQWNIGQRTLGRVLRRILALNPIVFRRIMGQPFATAVGRDDTLERFVRQYILVGTRVPPLWQARFLKLETLPETATAWAEAAAPYLLGAQSMAREYGFKTERGLALCFDIAVQNGANRGDHKDEYKHDLVSMLAANKDEEWERLKVLAEVVADLAAPRWHDDVLARKLTIAIGEGVVHGVNYNLERDFGIAFTREWGA